MSQIRKEPDPRPTTNRLQQDVESDSEVGTETESETSSGSEYQSDSTASASRSSRTQLRENGERGSQWPNQQMRTAEQARGDSRFLPGSRSGRSDEDRSQLIGGSSMGPNLRRPDPKPQVQTQAQSRTQTERSSPVRDRRRDDRSEPGRRDQRRTQEDPVDNVKRKPSNNPYQTSALDRPLPRRQDLSVPRSSGADRGEGKPEQAGQPRRAPRPDDGMGRRSFDFRPGKSDNVRTRDGTRGGGPPSSSSYSGGRDGVSKVEDGGGPSRTRARAPESQDTRRRQNTTIRDPVKPTVDPGRREGAASPQRPRSRGQIVGPGSDTDPDPDSETETDASDDGSSQTDEDLPRGKEQQRREPGDTPISAKNRSLPGKARNENDAKSDNRNEASGLNDGQTQARSVSISKKEISTDTESEAESDKTFTDNQNTTNRDHRIDSASQKPKRNARIKSDRRLDQESWETKTRRLHSSYLKRPPLWSGFCACRCGSCCFRFRRWWFWRWMVRKSPYLLALLMGLAGLAIAGTGPILGIWTVEYEGKDWGGSGWCESGNIRNGSEDEQGCTDAVFYTGPSVGKWPSFSLPVILLLFGIFASIHLLILIYTFLFIRYSPVRACCTVPDLEAQRSRTTDLQRRRLRALLWFERTMTLSSLASALLSAVFVAWVSESDADGQVGYELSIFLLSSPFIWFFLRTIYHSRWAYLSEDPDSFSARNKSRDGNRTRKDSRSHNEVSGFGDDALISSYGSGRKVQRPGGQRETL
ncbi:hypothetical protein IAR55_003950 [Kwoniella newhampshirensis]|uniref:G-protein coupled receptors family 1 profile domain-containing protein n=1 Tax=Kwoniella newhampshirensis TaxID=1651941 RepID=A0AAW0YM64_9TREE